MKRLVLIFLLLLVPLVANAQQTVFVPLCNGVDDTAAFSALVVGAGSNPRTIKIPYKSDLSKRCALTTLSFPANVTLDNIDGSGINRLAGETITVLGPVVNSPGKTLFFGSGTSSFVGNVFIGTVGQIQASDGAGVTSPSAYLSPLRVTLNPTPTYDLSSGSLAVAEIITFPNSTITVPANKILSLIRLSQSSGVDNVFSVGSGGLAVGIYSSLTLAAASHATAILYGGVIHGTNAGPGTVKGLHAGGFATGTSSGIINAGNFQIEAVATSSTASAGVFVTNTGVADRASAISILDSGNRYIYGIGTTVGPQSYQGAFIDAWMATGSASGARAFRVRANDGTELAFIHKDGTASFSNGDPAFTGTVLAVQAFANDAALDALKIQDVAMNVKFRVRGDGLISVPQGDVVVSTNGKGFGLNGNAATTQGMFGSTNDVILRPNTGGILQLQSAAAGTVASFSATGQSLTGSLLKTDHNSTDMGANGASSFRTIYAGTSFFGPKFCFSATVCDFFGSGSPENAVTAGIGSTYHRTDGGAVTSFYVKESGTGNTGWVAK